jgi:hypothetical protein
MRQSQFGTKLQAFGLGKEINSNWDQVRSAKLQCHLMLPLSEKSFKFQIQYDILTYLNHQVAIFLRQGLWH